MPATKGASKTKSYKGSTSKSKTTKAEVKSIVNRTLASHLEEKVAVKEIFNRVGIPGAGLDTANNLGLGTTTGIIPNISRGTDDASRVGDMIHAKRLMLKVSIRALDITPAAGSNSNRLPFMVRVIVFNHRFAIDEASATQIIDKGASSGNLDSSPDSWLEPYNKKEFKIWYSKEFKMAPFINNTGATPVLENMPAGHVYFANIRKEIKVPNKLLYNGATSLPTNSMPQLAFAVCNCDGTPLGSSQFKAQVNVETQLYFTDA